jgi:hypothetical protein
MKVGSQLVREWSAACDDWEDDFMLVNKEADSKLQP